MGDLENQSRNRKYNPLDEENYNVLLPQYEEKKAKAKGFILNEDGSMDADLATNAILNSLSANTNGVKFEHYNLLSSASTKVESDFVVKFKKKKKKKKKRKRKMNDAVDKNAKTTKKRKVDGAENAKYAFLDTNGSGDEKGKSRGKRDDILNALKASEIDKRKKKNACVDIILHCIKRISLWMLI